MFTCKIYRNDHQDGILRKILFLRNKNVDYDKYILSIDCSDFTVDLAFHVGISEKDFIEHMEENYNAKFVAVTSIYDHENIRMYFDTYEEAHKAREWINDVGETKQIIDKLMRIN